MEISSEMKRYILVVIAGIAIAAYIVPTNGLIDLDAAFAGSGGDTECEGGDAGDGGDGGSGGDADGSIRQTGTIIDVGDDSAYGGVNENEVNNVNTGNTNAVGGNGGNGGNGGAGGSCGEGGNGGN